MESQEGRHWFGPLAGPSPDGEDSEHLAGRVGAVWLEIGQALHPIIGHRGVAALTTAAWRSPGHRVRGC
jgi:hypothetical protein